MWSRKKRKKEAAAAAVAVGGSGGGVKEGGGGSNGSATTTAKLAMSDLSRSRSQSGSPLMRDTQQQRSGSVGPRSGGGGDGAVSQLANGALQPNKLQVVGGGSLASQVHSIQPSGTVATSVVVPTHQGTLGGPPVSNLNQNPPPTTIVPPVDGTVPLPSQLQLPTPVVNPSLLPPSKGGVGEQIVPQRQQVGGVTTPGVIAEGVQLKQAHKTLANPNIKPSLLVPLPTVPLSDSILDSLHEVGSKVDAGGITSSNNGNSNIGVGGGMIGATTITTPAATQGQLKDPSHATGAQGSVAEPPGGGGGLGVMVSPSTATPQQLQQVIEAQRTLLSQISKLVTGQKSHGGGPSSGGGMVRGHDISSLMTPSRLGGYPQRSSSIASHTRTFDYGNRSNKVLENTAQRQLEQEYYHGDHSARNC